MASVTVTVLGNTRQVTTSFDQLNARVAALRSEVLSVSTVTSLFGGALVPVAAAATSTALTLGAAAGAVGLFGAAVKPQFTAIQNASAAADKAQTAEATAARKQAEAHALAAKGGKDYKQALTAAAAAAKTAKDAQAAYQQQLAGMPPETAALATAFFRLKGDFKAWSDGLASHTLPVFTIAVNVLDQLLPKLSPLVANVGDQFHTLGDKVAEAASKPQVDVLITKFTDFAEHALAETISGVEQLAGWLVRGFQSQGFHNFLDEGKKDGPQIVTMLKELVEFVGKFVTASNGMDNIEFKALTTVVSLLNKIPQNVLSILAPTILGIAAAVKLWAIAQGALDVLLADNPLGMVLVLLTGVGIALYEAYQHSEAFRKVVNVLAQTLGDQLLSAMKNTLPLFKSLTQAAMTAFSVLIHGAADAFGWLPGIGGKLQSAAKNFDSFQNSVNSAFDYLTRGAQDLQNSLDTAMKERDLKVNISDWTRELNTAKAQLKSVPPDKRVPLLANINDLTTKINIAQREINNLQGKTVNIHYLFTTTGAPPTTGVPPGFLTGHAAGGAVATAAVGGPRGGYVLVGEQGPELARLPSGSSVIPAGQTRQMLGAGGGTLHIQAEWVGGNAGDDFMRWLRNNIRFSFGGDVQKALGQGY